MTARVTFSEMERFALNEASRIEITQEAMIKNGDRTPSLPDKMRDKEICEAILRLIDTCRADPIIMERLKAAAKVPA